MKVVVISTVQLDKKTLVPSSKLVELDAETAKELLAAGAVVKPGHPAAAALFEEEEAREAAAQAKRDAEAREQAEAEALQVWGADEELRKKHGNDFGVYLASLAKG